MNISKAKLEDLFVDDLVDQNIASWNRAVLWMRQLDTLSQVS